MSAGTGVSHSERNKNRDASVKFLQIWVLPNKVNVTPRYDQITLHQENLKNRLHQIISPNPEDEGIWIHQEAWFYLGAFDAGKIISYPLQNIKNGVYIFVLEGACEVNGERLSKRDGLGVWETSTINFEMSTQTKILVMEIPLTN